MNQLTGPISKFSTYSLENLVLSNNKFQGDFPNSIFEFLKNLEYLDVSSNYLSGLLDFSYFSKLEKLNYLDLSNNKFLSVDSNSRVDYVLPQLEYLTFSSCSVTVFPSFLPRLQNLGSLDLSNNKIHGKIPNWFSDNLLHTWTNMFFIDLSFNQLQGDLPIPPNGIYYFSVSNNNFTGGISSTICNARSLNMLILSHNNLTGKIPQCLGSFLSLQVLDLQINNFYGSIPENFSKNNDFETIKLNGNQLEGPIPQSLAHCKKLEVLDLSDNNIEDVFPSRLEALQELQLEGMIPTGKQFNTFQNDSYRGNPMLCGFPLSKSCGNHEEQPPSVVFAEAKESLFGWKQVVVGYGCGVVFGMFLGRLFIKTAKPLWLARLICGYT
ncbi:hypothetical protein AAHE18_07G052800 [Arachis hypogaea]